MKYRNRLLSLSLAFILTLILFTGCSSESNAGTVSHKYPYVVSSINSARAKLDNDPVTENTTADVYAEHLAEIYRESGSNFKEVARTYLDGTLVGQKHWKTYACVPSLGAIPSISVSDYIATISNITVVGISSYTQGNMTYTVIIGY